MARPRIRFGQPCSIDGCFKPTLNHGWCARHYRRWYRYGNPLAGGEYKGRCLAYLRDVVMAYEGDECLIWPYARNNYGYGKIKVSGRNHIASRFVCEEHRGPPPTPEHEAAHSCGNGHLACVTKRHLDWKTVVENSADMVLHGTSPTGERNASAKLTEADVYAIREREGFSSPRDIASEYGISRVSVENIFKRSTWRHLPEAPRVIFARIAP